MSTPDQENSPTRWQKLQQAGQGIDFPILHADYLAPCLLEIEPVKSTAWGLEAIGWTDLTAWMNITGIRLTPWEARTLIDAAKAWLNAHHSYNGNNTPSPCDNAQAIGEKVVRQFDRIFNL